MPRDAPSIAAMPDFCPPVTVRDKNRAMSGPGVTANKKAATA